MKDPRKIEEILSKPIHFDIDKALRRGWELFKTQPAILIVYTIVVVGFSAAASLFLGDFSSIFSLFVGPALTAGYYLLANRISRNDSVEFMDSFEGFKFWFPVVVVSLVTGLLTILGAILLILPGIYLGVAYTFAMPMVIFGGYEFWMAMELSRKLITKIWWRFFLFLLLLLVINLVGALFLLVGLLVTIPTSYMILYAAFEELSGELLEEEDSLPRITHESES
ncbi:DUF2189 domain-containing protein [Algoriphagus hitonicola]|uniref:Uncharacterized membrane protein n=1 Tax=Algoriphagus hitonicola TaxID=435880 RepID=A0A1I2XRK8_9BACT|nr:hypothetical protein [Algoriphagus hitonicola]SFH15356.1 Uncharacterized membrane protein [Algoriphagus hitonicola]